MTCATCRYGYVYRVLSELLDIKSIECRRYPPQFACRTDDELMYHFPDVSPKAWCGEYQPNEVTSGT